MGVYNNKNGVVTRVATNNILRNMNTEQYVTEGELVEAMAKKQDIMQFAVLPTASVDELGKIYQYVGETTTVAPIYTQGYFYKCVSDGGDPATYSWELISSSSGEFTPDPNHPLDTLYFQDTVTDKIKTVTVTNGKLLAEDYDSSGGGTTEVITITEPDNVGKSIQWENLSHQTIVEGNSSYVYGDTNYIDITNAISIVISAYATAALNSITYAMYDSNYNVLFVGDPEHNGIEVNTTNKFIQDFNIPLVSDAKYIKVNFWKNDVITWTHPVLTITKQTGGHQGTIQTIHFQNQINKNVMNNTDDTLTIQDGEVSYIDSGVLFLPSNYKEDGKKTRLVICCHGSGTIIDNNFTLTSKKYMEAIVKSGYAALDVNGGVADGRHFGAPFAIQSYIKAYHWAINNYNLYNEVLVYGASMGGLASFTLVNSGAIPVIAQAASCPVTDLFRQAWMNPWYSESGDYGVQRERIAEYYNFDNYASYESGSAKLATTADMQYFVDNYQKVSGYNPIATRAINSESIYTTATSNYDNLYNNMSKLHSVPVKIWHAKDDNFVAYHSSELLINNLQKQGQIAYLRSFVSGGHTPDLGKVIPMTDMNNIAYSSCVAYKELILWFKRWEDSVIVGMA